MSMEFEDYKTVIELK